MHNTRQIVYNPKSSVKGVMPGEVENGDGYAVRRIPVLTVRRYTSA